MPVCLSGREPWSTTASLIRGNQAEWLAQQIAEAFPWDTAPRYLIRDNDGAYRQAFTNRVRRMGIRDRPIAPRSPWQNPYVERLIGTLRRECLDHVLIFGEQHLRRVTWDWPRTHRTDALFNDPGPSSPRQLCPDCIIATPGYDFQEGQVSIEDTGIGIDPSHIDRVFEAFFTTKSNGMGMGLAICRSVIEAHSSRLWA